MSSVVEDQSVAAARRLSHGEQLARSARRYPDRVAVRCGPAAITYAELDQRVTHAANINGRALHALYFNALARNKRLFTFNRVSSPY